MSTDGGTKEFAYHQGTANTVSMDDIPHKEETPLIQWSASEFVDHQKNITWFVPLVVAILVGSAIIYLITRDILATIVIFLAGTVFGMYARQKPRTLTYTLLPTSMKIGRQSYSYDDFRTFSIIQEGPLYSIFLQPVKRFMPPLTIYFDPEDGEKIFDTLAAHLPHEERTQDPIERLMRKIRF